MKLKKIIFSIFLATMIGVLGAQPQLYAAQSLVEINGGVLEDGRTLIPMRKLFETLGAKVVWDGKKKTVTALKDKTDIILTIDSNKVIVNGKSITLDTTPKVIKSQTMVPVRFVSETLGSNVKWDPKTSIVSVITHDQVIKIKVENPQVELNVNEIKEIIVSAEKRLVNVVTADLPKQEDKTLRSSDINASKQKMKGIYTDKYINEVWDVIYSYTLSEPWYVNIIYSTVTDSYIITQTNEKIVVYYALYNDMDGDFTVQYTLIKKNSNWLIDDVKYNI